MTRRAAPMLAVTAALSLGVVAGCATVGQQSAPPERGPASVVPRPVEPTVEPIVVDVALGAGPHRGVIAGGRLWIVDAARAVAIDPALDAAGCDVTACVDGVTGAVAELWGRAWASGSDGALGWWDPTAPGRQELVATPLLGRDPVAAAGRVWVLDTAAGVVRSLAGERGEVAGVAVEVAIGRSETAVLAGDGEMLWVVRTAEAAAVAVDPVRGVATAPIDLTGGDPAASAQWPVVRGGLLHVVVSTGDAARLATVAPDGVAAEAPVPPVDAVLEAAGDDVVLTVGGFAALTSDAPFDRPGIHRVTTPSRSPGGRIDGLTSDDPGAEPPRPLGDGWFLSAEPATHGGLLHVDDDGRVTEHLASGVGGDGRNGDVLAAGTLEGRPWLLVSAGGGGDGGGGTGDGAELRWFRTP
ncbi:MAG: hypothetical protein S0880_02475 [Actinomycetota bacterium]|nr:hypothetical protein [Actinomycetota bacterium]